MTSPADHAAWNEAYERLRLYLETFALGDEVQVTRVALRLVDAARELHRDNPGESPTEVTLRHAQTQFTGWLGRNLAGPGESVPAPAAGAVALLLSGLAQNRPGTFLAAETEPGVRDALRRTLVVTGPDLAFSSMTPRHLDYGPMLGLARQTWHRWDAKTFAAALLFWGGVYGVCYWFFSEYR